MSAFTAEPCNHDPPAVVDGLCECGAAVTACTECGAYTADDQSMVNRRHRDSCSLHPDNVMPADANADAVWVEPLLSAGRTFGPYPDEVAASVAMDAHGLSDATHKLVWR